MSLEYRIGDVRDELAKIPDGSIDLIVTSPPFLALRSYLPADHPDKHREIGSEPTPADFLDTMLGLSAEFARVLAPHGSICVELGDTYSGGTSEGSDTRNADSQRYRGPANGVLKPKNGSAWPLAKSLTGIPTLYTWSLAYGRNLLTGNPSPAGPWRIRNLIVWARPNPPVGALGDKFRPATSYITVACKSAKRYFDLDAVRLPLADSPGNKYARPLAGKQGATHGDGFGEAPIPPNEYSAGAPPLDWHADDHPEDGDWLWKLSTQPYKGSHFATFPMALPKRMIEAMCPQRVCQVCGKPSERIVGEAEYHQSPNAHGSGRSPTDVAGRAWASGIAAGKNQSADLRDGGVVRVAPTLGWSDCGHDAWRVGVTLDPFAGSGTTLEAAQAVGRHAIGIDLDQRNATLAQERVGMFMEVIDDARTETDTTRATLLEVRSEGGR